MLESLQIKSNEYSNLLTQTPFKLVKESPINLVTANNLIDFQKILDRQKNILLLDYPLPSLLREKITSVSFENLPEFHFILKKEDINPFTQVETDEITQSILDFLLPSIKMFRKFFTDTDLKLSLIKTKGQPCPLFHVDKIKFRYLYTILGDGTEWADDKDVKRSGLGKGNNRKVLDESSTIYAADREQICLLKGESSLALKGRGVVHRSPPLSQNSKGRWLIRVDEML